MAASLWFPRELHGSVEWIKQERTTRQQEHSSSSSSTTFMSATVPRFDASLPPSLPALHSKQQTLANVLEPSYWQQLNPGLHVGDAAFISSCKAMKPPKSRLKDLCQQINEAGVAQVAPEELPWQVDLGTLADAVANLVRHGWPPSMLLVYDEVWAMVQQASAVMKKATGGNQCNMDILAWLVDPNRGDTGFSPHRDRQPDDSPATFRPDGTAMYATMWVPLTNATPENSCLYVIPRCADPGYYVGDPEEEGAPDPMTAALPNKEAYQHIRALPAQPGAALLFTHRTIHWGSKGRPGFPTPRISISWGCADDAYEPPYFSRAYLPCPPLELRLALVGAQMIIYHERFPAPPKQLRMYYEAFTAQSAKFDSSYRAKVVREFVDASKEAAAAAAAIRADPVATPAAASDVRGSSKGAATANGLQQGAHSPAAGSNGQAKTSKRKRRQAAAAAAAAAAAGQVAQGAQVAAVASTTPKATKAQQQSGAAAPKQHHQRQQQVQQVQQVQQTRQKASPAAADAMPPAAAESKRSKRQKRQHANGDAVAAAIAAAGAVLSPVANEAAASEPDSEDDGVGIDWALLAAQAKAQKAKGKAKAGGSGGKGVAGDQQGQQKGKKGPGKSGASPAAALAAAAAAAAESDDDDDVLDLALEAMLDGDGDFVDDYED